MYSEKQAFNNCIQVSFSVFLFEEILCAMKKYRGPKGNLLQSLNTSKYQPKTLLPLQKVTFKHYCGQNFHN